MRTEIYDDLSSEASRTISDIGMVEPPRRPRKPQGEVKRTAFGTRLRAELRDYLAVQAASNGRSLSEEIEYRLEHRASRTMRGAGRGLWHCYEFWRRLRPSTAVG